MMDPNDTQQKDAATFLAMMLLLVAAMGLMLLLFAVLSPALFWVVLLVGGIFWLSLFHYLVWGRWLSRYLKERVPDDSEEEEEFLKKYGPQE